MGNEVNATTSERREIFYTVRRGDTLSKIARTVGTPAKTLLKWNEKTLPDPNKLRIGQKLYRVAPYPGSMGNPGNVRRVPTPKKGEDRSSKGKFAKFTDPRDGLDAVGSTLAGIRRALVRKGENFTISNLAHIYAPTNENDTAGYIKDVSSFSGLGSDDVLNVSNTVEMAALLKAIVRRDSGKDNADWFTQDEYISSAQLVGQDPADELPTPEVPDETPQQDAKGGVAQGGDAGPGSATAVSETAVAESGPVDTSGPRIVINPSVFNDEKDALCVAFNEAFRLVMEDLDFRPEAEPTEAQRKFFADTAYRNDELQLRRTIMARICTFDTSVSGETAPTSEQVEESVYFLDSLLDGGYCQNDWEESRVTEIREHLADSVGEQEPGGVGAPAEGDGVEDTGEQAAAKGGRPSTWIQHWDGGRTIRDRSKTTIVTKGDSDWKKRRDAEAQAATAATLGALKDNKGVVVSGGDAGSSFQITGEALAAILAASEERKTPKHGLIGNGLSASAGHRLEDSNTGKGSINQGLSASAGHRLEDAGKGGLVLKGSSEARSQQTATQPQTPAQPATQPQTPAQPAQPQTPTQPQTSAQPTASAADGGAGASEHYEALEGAGQNPNQPPQNPNDPPDEGPTDPHMEETPAEGPTSQGDSADEGPMDPHDEEERRRLQGGQ